MYTNLEIYQNSLRLPRENLFALIWNSSSKVKINLLAQLLIPSIKEETAPMLEKDFLRFKFNILINLRRFLFKFNIPTLFFQTKNSPIIIRKVQHSTRNLLKYLKDAFKLWIKYFHSQGDFQMSISLHWDVRIKVKSILNWKQLKTFTSWKMNRPSNNK